MCGWLKSIDEQVKITNGTVRQHDKDIALIIQWKKIKDRAEERIETWSRKQLLFWGGVIFLIINTIILIGYEIIKTKIFN